MVAKITLDVAKALSKAKTKTGANIAGGLVAGELAEHTRIPVRSSNLDSVGYNPITGTLVVSFKSGRTYQYANVPANVYAGLMAADSIGSYFYHYIRDSYVYERIE